MIKKLDEILLEEVARITTDMPGMVAKTTDRLSQDPALAHLCLSASQVLIAYASAGRFEEKQMAHVLARFVIIWERTNNRFNDQLTGPEIN